MLKLKPGWIRLSWFGVALFALAVGVGFRAAAADYSVQPNALTCEYLTEPLGLDVAQPRLSWKLAATHPDQRSQCQTAYQILVASSKKLLAAGKADLWDSGQVASDQSVNQVYLGKSLESGQACYWTVRVADEAGHWSDWSASSQWTMGLLHSEDWHAAWIGAASAIRAEAERARAGNPPDPWLRKTFELPARPVQAVIYVASVGYHELYVNGHKVDDTVLAPGTTDYRVRARYVTYDITKFLRRGRNAIGIWLGTAWSIFPPYQTENKPCGPLALAQAELQFKDGQTRQIVTDATWKTHPSPNTLLGNWDANNFGGEAYDARNELPDWDAPSCDDAAWPAATVSHPDLKLSAMVAPPNRRVKPIKPLGMQEVKPGVYRVDLGVNFAGWVEVPLTGAPGDRVEFQFSERAEEAMTHNLHSTYVIGPSGKGTFCNRFNYAVGRWVQISGLKTAPALDQIRGWLIRTDYERVGGFECNDPLLNRIYETSLWTFENLSLGGYVVDCPQRERRGYGGDAHATMDTALDNYSLGAFYTKWAQDWRDVQQPDGDIPYTAPTYSGGGGPGWSGYCITLPEEIYHRYGDIRILEENFPMMQRWLAFMDTKATNNILQRWGGDWDFLGDWLWPGASGGNDKTDDELFFNNCYWIYSLQRAAQIAAVLGHEDQAAQYRQRATEVRQAVHQAFFHPADNSYVSGQQNYLAVALLADVPPESLRPAVWQRLEHQILVQDQGHIHAGITGGALLFKLLLDHQRSDLIYRMASQTNYPGWGQMLNDGATTFYEDWHYRWSRLHSSYLYIGRWFTEGLAGIGNPGEAGFQHFTIAPWIAANTSLTNVTAHYDSLYGRIAVHWTRQGDKLELQATVPPNTHATLRLPGVVTGSLTEDGRPPEQSPGIRAVAHEAGKVVAQLDAGHYEFSARLNPAP